MTASPIPPNEPTRLAKLESLGILYTPAEERFDRITQLARRIFDTPIALISLVTEKTLWFKSAQGLHLSETSRETSFCGHAIMQQETLMVPDTQLDPQFANNPLVTGAPNIRFYAGHPIAYQGENIGTLCIIDQQPRKLSDEDVETLQSLAAWVENELKVSALSEAQKQLVRERDEAQRRTLIDPLTKLWNRSGLEYLLLREFSAAQRKKGKVVLMLVEIDHLQQVLDIQGEAARDTAIKEVTARIRALVRPHDLMIRYSPNQFLLYAEDCPADTGIALAERMLARIASQHISHGKRLFTVKLSIGLAAATAHQNLSVVALVKGAEIALKEAYAAGRNCAKSVNLPQPQ